MHITKGRMANCNNPKHTTLNHEPYPKPKEALRDRHVGGIEEVEEEARIKSALGYGFGDDLGFRV